jgi:hypothetical protein
MLNPLNIINNTCFNSNDGKVFVQLTSVNFPYSVSWSPSLGTLDQITDSTFQINNLSAGNYELTITDNFGCLNNSSFNISNPSPVNCYTSPEILVCKNESVEIFASAAGGIGQYIYNWLNDSVFQSNNSLIISTTVPMSIGVFAQDSNGCVSDTNYISISIKPDLEVYVSSQNTCPDLNTGSILLNASGNYPYSYLWSTGETTSQIINLNDGDYLYTVTDACFDTIVGHQIITEMVNAKVSGVIQYSGGNFNSGDAEIKLYDVNIQGLNYISNTVVENGGMFNLNIPNGSYRLKADILNHGEYPMILNTYYDSTYKWNEATTLTLNCGDSTFININMVEVAQQATGNGVANGNIIYVSNNKSINGIPVTGADIIVEKTIDNSPVIETQSDTDGNYFISNIPYGDFSIYVDIPGIPMITTHSFAINEEDSTFENLNFYVDTITNLGIYADSTLLNSSVIADNFSIKVNPNPFIDELNINYTLKNNSNVNIELFDIKGVLIKSILKNNQKSGSYNMKLNTSDTRMIQGTYFLKIEINNEVYIRKLIMKKD